MDKMKNSDVQFNESYEVHLVYKVLSKNKENKSAAIERQPKMADFLTDQIYMLPMAFLL